jgi:hypothetical protein
MIVVQKVYVAQQRWVGPSRAIPKRGEETMKQILLATALIALPVAGFTGYMMYLAPTVAVAGEAVVSLGDMTPFKTIIADVQGIAATGDFVKAETRITDFETAWDDAESTMRPLNTAAWGTVDDAADAALKALRKGTPVANDVTATLAALGAVLDNPTAGADAGTVAATLVNGIAVTDDTGHALPCEDMIGMVRDALPMATLAAADAASVADLQARATERCNADDDTRADGFSAQALAIITQ